MQCDEMNIASASQTGFVANMQEVCRGLAQNYGMQEGVAREFAHALCLIVTARWGGERPYIRRTAVITERHARIYALWRRIRKDEPSDNAAACRIANETAPSYTSRHILRIIAQIENNPASSVMESH